MGKPDLERELSERKHFNAEKMMRKANAVFGFSGWAHEIVSHKTISSEEVGSVAALAAHVRRV